MLCSWLVRGVLMSGGLWDIFLVVSERSDGNDLPWPSSARRKPLRKMRVARGFQLRYVKGVKSTPAAARIQYMPMTHRRAKVGRRSAVVGTLRPRSCRACAGRGAWVPVSAWRGADPCTPVLTSSQRNLSQREVPEAREPLTTAKVRLPPCNPPFILCASTLACISHPKCCLSGPLPARRPARSRA